MSLYHFSQIHLKSCPICLRQPLLATQSIEQMQKHISFVLFFHTNLYTSKKKIHVKFTYKANDQNYCFEVHLEPKLKFQLKHSPLFDRVYIGKHIHNEDSSYRRMFRMCIYILALAYVLLTVSNLWDSRF